MTNLWNIIVESNTFNFIILVVIFLIVFKELNVPEILTKIRDNVAKSIENANNEKDNAIEKLDSAKKVFAKTDKDIEEKMNNAKLSAKTLVEEIDRNTLSKIERINNNISMVTNSEERRISDELISETMEKATNLALQKIKIRLNEDSSLHDKFIEQSIEEIRSAYVNK